MDTTVYRFLSFFAQIQLIESKLIYVDTTISQKKDIRMLKYFRIFHEVMCDVELFKGFSYDKNIAKDHFFTTPFYNLSNCLIHDDHVINLDEFLAQKKTLLSKIATVYLFFDGMTPEEERLRCERMKIFHLVLIAFLNEYGYDYQKTDSSKLRLIKKQMGKYKLLVNFEHIVKKYKLNKTFGQFERIIKVIR